MFFDKNNGLSLEMSCHDAYYLLHDVLNNIFLNYQEYLSFQLNNNVPVGIGSTISNLDEGVISVNIGIKEIPDVKNQNVTDYNFMLCLVGIYHEYRHVQQFFEIFHQDIDLGRYLTMNYFAEYENNEYCCKNYWLNPKKLDAQYFGLVRAYQYCEAQFGHDEAERLLCNYQNTRIRNGKKVNGLFHRHRKPDYLDFQNGKPYESSDEIFDAMDVELEKSFHAHRIYDVKAAAKNSVQNRSVLFFQKNAKISHEMDYLKCFTSCQDGYLQDKMLTAIFLSDPEYHKYYQSRFESIADMDLSIETVFHDAMRLERGRELDAKFGNMITSENQYESDMEKE